jgi:hypothetical protein
MSTTPPFPSTGLRQVHRNRWILGLAASPALLTLAAIVAGFTVKAAFFGFMLHPLIVSALAIAYAWRKNPWPVIEPTAVRADGDGVHVGARHIPRAEIRAGFVLPGARTKVLLRRRRRLPVELEVSGTDQGRALLRALGLDVTQSVARFRALSRAVAKRRYAFAAVGGFMAVYAGFVTSLARHHHGGPSALAGIAFALGVIGLVVTFVMPTWLSVGADGVVVSWFGRKRFVSYADIALVGRYDKGWGRSRYLGVTLHLRSGEALDLPITQSEWGTESVALLEERLREAMEAHHSGDATADAALLRRGDREVSDWVSALRAIGAGANADMRTAPLPRERLFRIVEDPASAAADRAAAAVALGTELDDEARARLRGAAEATAAPRLRVVIEAAAASTEQAELEAALAELDDQERRARVAS